MNRTTSKPLVILLAFMMLQGVALQADRASSGPSGPAPMGGPGPMSEPADWFDPLDDISHVYVPPGGIMGVEVSGGEAHLLPGYNDGWLASEVIRPPTGYRCNLVLVEADTPGASKVQITLLDPTKDPTEVGFANETIPNFVKLETRDVDAYGLDTTLYPGVRIQVNLVASGADRPRLLSWSMQFIGFDEWRDDFLGASKMEKVSGINVTDGGVELNLSRRGGGAGNYPRYPSVLVARYGTPASTYDALYPLSDHSGYKSSADSVQASGVMGFALDDLNGDGNADLVLVSSSANSQIQWGTGADSWTATGATSLQTSNGRKGDTGDFNGDGEPDVVIIGRPGSGSGDVRVFLNKGGGSFNTAPDRTMTGITPRGVSTGDINGDGFDDIVVAADSSSPAFFGGSSGPDTTADKSFPSGSYYGDCYVGDLNGDGHKDVVISLPYPGSKTNVFMGSDGDIDTTADYVLDIGTYYTSGVDAGDVNGDGYVDIVVLPYGQSLQVFRGSSSGWSDAQRHTITLATYGNGVDAVDVDLDGFADIFAASGNNLQLFRGAATLPTSATFTIGNFYWPPSIKVAVPKTTGSKYYIGSFISDAILLPDDVKWDIAVVEGSVPANTSVLMSVLDMSGKEYVGLKDVPAMDLDLSSITTDRLIKVKVTLLSDLPGVTPRLDVLRVRWMEKNAWREQCYGSAKVERLVNTAIVDGIIRTDVRWTEGGGCDHVLFTSLRGDTGYSTRPVVLDYHGYPEHDPVYFDVTGTSSVDSRDVNADGLEDVVFAVYQTGDSTYSAKSPLFLGHPAGFRPWPSFEFPTVGAMEVLMRDLNRDGHADIVFAQEQDGTTFAVNSTLFWGSASGWNATPDVGFATRGASDVDAVDIDGDGRLDLAFACYKDVSTSTDSLVFRQGTEGFCGTTPTYRLPTQGARGVASGDIDDDGRIDLVFANSFAGGNSQIDSFVYWGRASGGFEPTTGKLPTVGAEDVVVGTFDDHSSGMDIAFANYKDNTNNRHVDSSIFHCDGTRALPSVPSIVLPTVGAFSVNIAMFDDVGSEDLVFACRDNGTSYNVTSCVFDASSTPSFRPWFPTVGATDGIGGGIMPANRGAYMSMPISPVDWREAGSFHTLRYTAQFISPVKGKVQVIDASTWDVLAETELKAGGDEWVIDGLFSMRDHPSVRVLVTAGKVYGDDFTLDDLWLNWTSRAKQSPRVLGIDIAPPSILRMRSSTLTVDVTDEYDATKDLHLTVMHRLNGTTVWDTNLLGTATFTNGTWTMPVFARADALVGPYDLRVVVVDLDMMSSGQMEFPNALVVLNNVPTAPEVRIIPESPTTSSTLSVQVVTSASDIEASGLTYRYTWFRDGERVTDLTSDTVIAPFTERGQNWSVEVRAFDGIDEGAPASAWVVIVNAPPQVNTPLPSPEIQEDAVDDQWIDLSKAFEDPDGDALAYTVNPVPEHIRVTIDPATGKVTLRPEQDWSGEEGITFWTSDGTLSASQTALVTVTAVNDRPRFTTVNGAAITADPVALSAGQGEQLVIAIGAMDVEGDELVFSANTTAVEVDEATGAITFQPENDEVGTLRFALTMYDMASPSAKVTLNFTITVVNRNDPMDAPRIINPRTGDKFKAGTMFSLIGVCTDPDTQYGQQLTFKWYWNGTNLIGEGTSLTWNFTSPGTYNITLTVSDGEFTKEAWALITIEPKDIPTPQPPDGVDGDGGGGIGTTAIIGILVVLVVIGGVIFLVMSKRREEAKEAAEEKQEKHEALKHMAAEVRATADQMELELGTAKVITKEGGVRTAELEEIKIEAVGAMPEKHGLSMEMRVTEEAPKDVQQLFSQVGGGQAAGIAPDAEAMRVDNLKRKYATAIGRLPYGIPAADLKGMDWNDLAAALATGQKKTLPDGHETTQVKGKWYYSDPSDSSTFLKEHGARPKAEPGRAAATGAAAPKVDKSALLEKLEERFILGEISEQSYRELKRKLEGAKGGARSGKEEWIEEE